MTYGQWMLELRKTPNSAFYPEPLVRFQPTSVNVPENLGVIATQDVVGMRELSLLHRNNGNIIRIEDQETLEVLNFPNLNRPAADIIISGNASLSTLTAPNIGLPSHGNAEFGASLDFSDNALDATSVDAIFNRLALSLSSGVEYYTAIDTSGGTNAAPTAASSLARSSLYLTKSGYEISVATN